MLSGSIGVGKSVQDDKEESCMAEMVLIRHGASTWNLEGRIQGQSDCPLSEAGLKQAVDLAAYLADESFDVLITSDLKRAIDTARPIASTLGLRVQVDKRLRERGLGELEGTYLDCGDLGLSWFDSNNPRYPVSNGESVEEFLARVVEVLEELGSRHSGKRFAVVTHGGVLGCALMHTFGLAPAGPSRFAIGNGNISRFLVRDQKWVLYTWGEVPPHWRHGRGRTRSR